jgi:hypothetical protein
MACQGQTFPEGYTYEDGVYEAFSKSEWESGDSWCYIRLCVSERAIAPAYARVRLGSLPR